MKISILDKRKDIIVVYKMAKVKTLDKAKHLRNARETKGDDENKEDHSKSCEELVS